MDSCSELDIETSMISKMVYEDNRLKTFTDSGRWPFSKDCNCTPEKVFNHLKHTFLIKFLNFIKFLFLIILDG